MSELTKEKRKLKNLGKKPVLSLVLPVLKEELNSFNSFIPGATNQDEWRSSPEEIKKVLSQLIQNTETWLDKPTKENREKVRKTMENLTFDIERGWRGETKNLIGNISMLGRVILEENNWASYIINSCAYQKINET